MIDNIEINVLILNCTQSSHAGEFHPYVLTEPCVRVSPHTALHVLCRCEYTHGCTNFQCSNKPGDSLYCRLSQRTDAYLYNPFSHFTHLSKRWLRPFHTGRIPACQNLW